MNSPRYQPAGPLAAWLVSDERSELRVLAAPTESSRPQPPRYPQLPAGQVPLEDLEGTRHAAEVCL